MRISIPFLFCFSLCPAFLFAQLPAGSIANYPLNNSAADISGNGYDGTLNSTSADLNRFGTGSSATAFTAGTSTGTLPGSLATALSGDFSIAYWFKTAMTAPTATFWYSGIALVDAEVCGGTNDWGTALIDGGKVCMGIGNPDLTIKSTSSNYNDGLWHFVTATRNQAAAVIKLYIDGSQVATTSGTNSGALTAPTLVGMGRNPCVAGGVYTGDLDDVIAYNRVLSSAEVTNLYNYYISTPLPLLWKSFTGKLESGEVYLNWETENSINNDRFEIERSSDGANFSGIGVISDKSGIDNAAGGAGYSFTDPHPQKGGNFYRIRQVDIDGKYSWSSVVEVSVGSVPSAIHLQSNPVADEAILVNNDHLLVRRMQVIDVSGRILFDRSLYSSNSILKINTQGLRPGYYWLRIDLAGKNTTLPFLK
jgi:concanavalin A-like lectin/glucanase superfamily protein